MAKINKLQVIKMCRNSFTVKHTAGRFKCSPKTFSRILKEYKITPNKPINRLLNTNQDHQPGRFYYYNFEKNYSKIAQRLGITRQVVWKNLYSVFRYLSDRDQHE
jgi:AraC-like DNA-binding protein